MLLLLPTPTFLAQKLMDMPHLQAVPPVEEACGNGRMGLGEQEGLPRALEQGDGVVPLAAGAAHHQDGVDKGTAEADGEEEEEEAQEEEAQGAGAGGEVGEDKARRGTTKADPDGEAIVLHKPLVGGMCRSGVAICVCFLYFVVFYVYSLKIWYKSTV